MRNDARRIVFRWPCEDRREAKDTRAQISRVCVVLNVTFAHQLGPLKRRLPCVVGAGRFVDEFQTVSVTAVNVFRRRVNKDWARFHIAQHVRSAGPIRAKALARAVRTFVEVRGEMDHDVVARNSLDCLLVTNVETRAARKVVGVEEVSDESAEVSAAARDESLHASTALSAWTRPRASALSRLNDSALPIAISMSPPSILVSPSGLKMIVPLVRRILTITMFNSDLMMLSLSLR